MSGMSDDRSLAVGEEPVEILHPHWKPLVRPVGLAVAMDGSLLIADDTGGTVWRVAYTGK